MPREPRQTAAAKFEEEKWRAELEFEREKWRAEIDLRNREVALKDREQSHRGDEIALKRQEAQLSRWTNPLVLAIIGASVAGLANMGLTWLNSRYQIEQDQSRATQTLALEKEKAKQTFELEGNKAKQTLELEKSKSEAARILEMIKTNSSDSELLPVRLTSS